MISNSNFEKLWFFYKIEGESNKISINDFCIKHGVEYTKSYAWLKRTKKQVAPVKEEWVPTINTEAHESSSPTTSLKKLQIRSMVTSWL